MKGVVLLAGPDGTGKSSITDQVVSHCAAVGTQVRLVHYRPRLVGAGDPAPVTDPHKDPPRGAIASVAKLIAIAFEFLLAYSWTWRRVRRQGLVLIERGWWDMAVDPRRYRLPATMLPLVRAIGCILPKVDVVVLLGGDPAAIHRRKPEIGVEELTRQLVAWRSLAPKAGRRIVTVDTVAGTLVETTAAVVSALRTDRMDTAAAA